MKRVLCLLFLAAAAHAQAPDAAWRTVTTKHFRIHYPAPYEGWTMRAAGRLESIRDAVEAEVGYAPETVTDVIVENPIAQANGLTLPLLDTPRIVLFTESPDPSEQIGEYSDWVDLLTVHEVTHLLHLTRPSRNPLERFSERFLPLNPIALDAPRWIHEGYATVIEGRITGAGRPHSTLRALILRRWAETGNLPTYTQLAANDKFLGMSMAYLMGSAYLEWLEQRAGEGSLRKLWARMTARHRRSFDEAFAGVFGDSPERLYGIFTAELTRRFPNVRPIDGELFQVTAGNSGDPDVSPDGKSIVVVLRARSKPSRLVVWSTGPATEEEEKYKQRIEKILQRDPEDVAPVRSKPLPRKPLHSLMAPDGGDIETPRWTPDGNSILYVHRQPDRDGFLHHDLFRWTPATGENVRITHLADVTDADPMPDGKSAIAVQSRFGYSQLVMVNLLTGAVAPHGDASLDEVFSHPRANADGQIAYVHHVRGHWLLEPAWTTAHVVSAEWSGNAIVSPVFESSFADLHRFTSDNDEQLTRAPGGAFEPATSPDGRIFFMSLEPDGYVLRVLTPEPIRLSLPAIEEQQPRAVALTSQPVSPSHPYGIGRQEFATIFGGTYTSHEHATEAGIRLGDVVGRLDTIAVGSIGDIHGGAIASTWRGWPIHVGAHLFSFEHQHGAELRVSWRAQWPLQSIAIDGGHVKNAFFSDLRWTARQERFKTSEEITATLQSHVRRAKARGSMRMFGYRLSAQLEHAESSDQLIPLGGIATTIMPRSLIAQRIIDPALAPSTLTGDRYNGGRVEIASGYITAFYQQHRLDGQRLGYIGAEVTMSSPPITWVKAPGFDLSIGAARVEGKSRWWAGLRWRP
ncbi:MAG TPA: hypothetical protein VJ901_23110 [Thermoanaerobaculia bacterium]|nr:hypothetical protein [Thermoanaerobaculia bacterium]